MANADAELDIDAALDSVLGDMELGEEDIDFEEVGGRITEFAEDPLVKVALQKGLDLREYAKQVEDDLLSVEKASVEDYIQQAPHLEELNKQIQACDDILSTMEVLLRGFQADLGNISQEIQALQDQSVSMSIKIKNRKQLQTELGSYLNEIVITEDLIKKIDETEVGENYIPVLATLNRKIAFIREKEASHYPSIDSVAIHIERLRNRASERVRDFLLVKIRNLRNPRSNPAVQQKILLKFKALNVFLIDHAPMVAKEVHDNYNVLMKDFYFKSFQKYTNSITKMAQQVGEKTDVLALESDAKKGLFGATMGAIGSLSGALGSIGKSTTREKVNAFELGDRENILHNMDSEVIVAHTAEEGNMKFTFEHIFRSINRALMDNASSEYLFLWEFFDARGDAAQALFMEIFDTTIALAMQTFKQYLEESYDALGILLCIRINMEHQRMMMQRRVPCLDMYINQVNILLWPRFQRVMDRHIVSLRKANVAAMGSIDTNVHPTSRKFAAFAGSILILNHEQNLDPVNSSCGRMRFEMENLLLCMAAEFSDRRKHLIFLINNYDAIRSYLADLQSGGADAEREHWQKLLDMRIDDFVEEELIPFFSGLMQFVKKAEQERDIKDVEVGKYEKVSADFNAGWKNALTSLNNNVTSAFANNKTASLILQSVLRQLFLYYSRFVALVEKRFGRNQRPPFREELVGLEKLKIEIKKLNPRL